MIVVSLPSPELKMSYLDEWSALEEFSNSLSNALLSSSLRLPVSGEVRVDAMQIGEALNSAMKVVELIGSHVQIFFPKAEEMDVSILELARMVGGVKALVEECRDLLSKTPSSQGRIIDDGMQPKGSSNANGIDATIINPRRVNWFLPTNNIHSPMISLSCNFYYTRNFMKIILILFATSYINIV